MRERNREIHRRQQRHIKRKKLRKKLEAATTDMERGQLLQKIRRTIPKFTPEA
jgi:hypothetical protein